MIVLGLSLFPIPLQPLEIPPNQNFIPFLTIGQTFSSTFPKSIAIKYFIKKIALFIPFGLLFPFFIKNHKFLKSMLYTLLFSALIESFKFIIGMVFLGFMYQNIDIDNIILSFIGAIIGYILFTIIPSSIKEPFIRNSRKLKMQIYRPEIILKK